MQKFSEKQNKLVEQLQEVKAQLEQQMKLKDEELKSLESSLKKKNAILTQNIEFKELELNDARE